VNLAATVEQDDIAFENGSIRTDNPGGFRRNPDLVVLRPAIRFDVSQRLIDYDRRRRDNATA